SSSSAPSWPTGAAPRRSPTPSPSRSRTGGPEVDFAVSDVVKDSRAAVRALCADFPGSYWRALEPDRYPTEFVGALTANGWLAALIPEEYGGSGLGVGAASAIFEEICAC